ncbi:MAG TPA: chorismate mutase [Anaeromyxobacteraceae bacterium]|nr:chorismate mutase [Anaeromyxobacteraceae bacterium]
MRAIRGAITVEANTAPAIAAAVKELVEAVVKENQVSPADIVSAIFTLTPDLDADFPARPAREVGWANVPMICAQEIAVPGALPRVCRLIVHARGRKTPRHVYLREARVLRPDLHE